ncbi:hypothetical protein [Streptomyces sp. 2P-4]|uniref:hypothetical protein n=1 Tax=Streptomyces sp. 2P-4 TaxID=2931974 RepID=UPI0025417328|nr:hypothetical protein [Streptomyces sp. 2P-4]
MAEAVPVRCPECLRENGYCPPAFPCACGAPAVLPLDPSAQPAVLTHRNWSEAWVRVRCAACGRVGEWPQPEVGCGSCGTVVRLAVLPAEAPGGAAQAYGAPPGGAAHGSSGARPAAAAAAGGGPGVPVPRAPFRPVTIRTARDAVATAALYLRWLGFRDVRRPEGPPVPSAAVDLRAPGLVAQVDPTTAPAGLRAVECVWLNGLAASASCVYFALAGYTHEARSRADALGIPLFIMDLTGMPQPLNEAAEALVTAGA